MSFVFSFAEVLADHTHKLSVYRYPWFLEDWDGYEFPIQRADAIRYFVLAHYGGIYIDLDDVSSRASKLCFPMFESSSQF